MKSSAAVPFELPTRSAMDSGGLPGSAFSLAWAASPDPGDGASFDDVLKANAPVVPQNRLQEGCPEGASISSALPETRGPAFIVPANFQNRVPMPSSLVRQITAEEEPKEAVDSEVSGEAADGAKNQICGVVFEWVCSLNQPAPPMPGAQVADAEPKETAASSCETATPPSARVSTGITAPERSDETDGSDRPKVLRREIMVSGRRMEASSLGEFAVAGAGRGLRSKETKAEAQSTAPVITIDSAKETVPSGGLVLEGFEPVTGGQALSVLRSIFSDQPRPAASPAPILSPTERLPEVRPTESRSSTPAVDLRKAVDLLKVVENRLKAEGIQTASPIRIEIVEVPTANQPGEFKVEAEGRKLVFSGWWDKEGRMVDSQALQGAAQSEARSDGKNPPSPPAASQNRIAETGRFPETNISASSVDSSAKQAVSTTNDPLKPVRIPSVATGGISTARQAIVMRSTNDQEESAGNTGNQTSANRERAGETIGQESPRDLLTELAAMPFADRPDRLENRATLPGLGIDRIGQADRIDKMDAVEKLRSVINHELAVLKTSGADALAVVIRPTADSEVFIQLTREKGGIEAFIRMEKGDSSELRRQWSQLEGALAEQQVKLQPLQSSSSMMQDSDPQSRHGRFSQEQAGESSGAQFSFDGNSRGGFRQEDSRRPQSPFEPEPPLSPRNPNPSTPRSAPRRGTSTDRNFDNWA